MQLRLVAQLLDRCRRDLPAALAGAVAPGQVEGYAFDLAVNEARATLGISASAAGMLAELAWRLFSVLPNVLAALSDTTRALDDGAARAVAAELLSHNSAQANTAQANTTQANTTGPWDGPWPRAWRARVERAVVRADTAAAAAHRDVALQARQVRAWPEGNGTGVLQVRADAYDIAMVDQVVTDLAYAWLTVDQSGEDWRDALPQVPSRRAHDLGLVVHADTLDRSGHCSFYDCPRLSRRCDLDHDTPWPRGPTDVANLDPKCRGHRQAKTLGLVRTELRAGPGAGPRQVTWWLPHGLVVRSRPEPFPGVDHDRSQHQPAA